MPSAHDVVEWLDRAATDRPEQIVAEDTAGRQLAYGSCARLSRAVQSRLVASGVRPGDRVGVLMRKSLDTLVAFQATLRAGAVYVPVDPLAPVTRAAIIFHDCRASAVFVDAGAAEPLRREMERLGSAPVLLIVPDRTDDARTTVIDALALTPAAAPAGRHTDDLAFLLYTSGSTATPKAVMITHANVVDFVDWCSVAFAITSDDRIATHAPLHFSLCVFNLYVAWKHAATMVLIDEDTARVPQLTAPLIERHGITIWFSTPTILSLLVQSGMLESIRTSTLRLIMFGGEPFPIDNLRRLRKQVPHPRYFHILGSTETHMISVHELPASDVSAPVPIGRVCDRFEARLLDEDGNDVASGADGELCLTGPGVTPGYWNMPADRAGAFFSDGNGRRWYRTGDIVADRADGNLVYRGRRDRMVKKRGYRVELGEIEACLYRHPGISEAAVVATADDELGVRVHAFVVSRAGSRVTIVDLKAHCAGALPIYMVPDVFRLQGELPRTSTGKVDFPGLKSLAAGREPVSAAVPVESGMANITNGQPS